MLRVLVAAFALATTAVGVAQTSVPTADIARTVDEIVRLVKQRYVFPAKADAIVTLLRKGVADGRYAGKTPQEVAAAMTEDLQSVTRDKHMNVKYNPQQAAGLVAPGGPTAPAGADAFYAKMMATSNYGIPELKVMPENVRYMNVSPAFLWHPEKSPKAIDAAMEFLRGGDAYVIDLRKNGGGSPATVRYIISHFMEPGQKLMTYHMGPDGTSESVSQSVTGGRLPAKPLYVLTSPGTGSASEEFAAHVRNFKLGTLVGTPTAGAGHRNALFGTPAGFVVSISIGTAVHPVTNTGWEGTGVAPHIEVPPADALDRAHAEAVKAIKESGAGIFRP